MHTRTRQSWTDITHLLNLCLAILTLIMDCSENFHAQISPSGIPDLFDEAPDSTALQTGSIGSLMRMLRKRCNSCKLEAAKSDKIT